MSRLARILDAPTLDDLYALIPQPTGCDGSCHASCGPLGFSSLEGERIKAAGATIANVRFGEHPAGIDCPALTVDKRCSIYDARPTLCRLWGSAVGMLCHAQTCTTRAPLTREEGRAALLRAEQLSTLQHPPMERTA